MRHFDADDIYHILPGLGTRGFSASLLVSRLMPSLRRALVLSDYQGQRLQLVGCEIGTWLSWLLCLVGPMAKLVIVFGWLGWLLCLGCVELWGWCVPELPQVFHLILDLLMMESLSVAQ